MLFTKSQTKIISGNLCKYDLEIFHGRNNYLNLFEYYSKVLEDHRNTCEHEGKYVEAEMAKNRIAELKYQDYERKKNELMFNQA